jgi:hypothetical protein
MLTLDRINEVRNHWNAWVSKYERELANRLGTYHGSSRHPHAFKFALFVEHVQRCERTANRFADHIQRVADTLEIELVDCKDCHRTVDRTDAVSVPINGRVQMVNYFCSACIAQRVA